MTRSVLVLLPLVSAFAESALVRDWQVEIPMVARTTYPTAVCPDGRVYISNARGDVVSVSAAGALGQTQSDVDGFDLARFMTCTANGTLWVATGRSIAGYQPRLNGKLELSARVPVDVPPARFAVGPEQFYVLDARAAVNDPPLWIVDRNGRRIRGFGRASLSMVRPQTFEIGFPLWAADRDELIFIPRYGYRIQVFDREGNWVRPVDGPSSLVLPVSVGQRQVQEILGATLLHDGRLVVLARGNAGRAGGQLAFLDVYDRDLNLAEDTIPAAAGNLIGSSDDGALYFASRGVSTLRITRMQLRR